MAALWLKERTARIQPFAGFQHQALVVARGASPADVYLFSTSGVLNEVFGGRLRPAALRLQTEDADQDGLPEVLRAQVTLSLATGEEVHGITAFIALEYAMQSPARFQHNATAIVHHDAGHGGSALHVFGDLELRSDVPLSAAALTARRGPEVLLGITDAEDVAAVDPLRIIQRFDPPCACNLPEAQLTPLAVARRYAALPTAVHLLPRYPVWTSGAGMSTFDLNVTMAVRPQVVFYAPEIAELLKFAWVQYLALLIPVAAVFTFLRRFAAFSHITPCRVVSDLSRGAKAHDF